jgi:hypothetical protein
MRWWGPRESERAGLPEVFVAIGTNADEELVIRSWTAAEGMMLEAVALTEGERLGFVLFVQRSGFRLDVTPYGGV